jgi:hypothetical protein
MSDYTPVYGGDDNYTATASAVITGGQLVSVSGDNTVAPSTTGDHSVGVSAHDAPSGGRVMVYCLSGVITHELTVQGVVALVAGNPVIAGTTGFINTGALAIVAANGTLLGICTRGGTGGTGTGKARFIGV